MAVRVFDESMDVTWLPLPPLARRAEIYAQDFSCGVDTRCTPSTDGRRHLHRCIEIVVAHKGAVLLSYDRSVQLLSAGDAMVFAGGVLHGGRAVGGSYTRTAFHLVIKPTTADSLHPLLTAAVNGSVCAYLPIARQPEFFTALSKLRGQANQNCIEPNRTLLSNVLYILQAVKMPRQDTLHPIVRESLVHMMEIGEIGRVGDLAQMLHVSESCLFALYQKELLCSPHQLWLQIQIEQACNQILHDKVMVGELVDMLGFSSRRCFERAFRRHTGMSVSQYREYGLGSFW